MNPKQEEYIPKWLAWESTQRCNLNCVHCRCSSDMQAVFVPISAVPAFPGAIKSLDNLGL